MASPVVRAYLNQLATGDAATDWLTWVLQHPLLSTGPLADRGAGVGWRVLVLGCGGGWLERAIAVRPEIASIDACDVAEQAVAEARAEATRGGLAPKLSYHVVDLNHEPPPGGPYDLVIAHSVLHHVENLEYAYAELAQVLAPEGALVVNEYVGPRRFQFGDDQMAVINGFLARLPERYRHSVMMPGAVFPHKVVPTVEEMIATDPSESVRSDELLAFTRRYFRVAEEVAYGGTVLQHGLYDIVQNFDPTEADDVRLLGLLCLLEEALLREGVLPSDYALLLATQRVTLADGAEERATNAAAVALYPQAETRLGGQSDSPRGGLWLAPRQPVPRAVPVEAILAATTASQSAEPAATATAVAPRLRIHSRPLRDRRHGLDLEPVRRHVHRLATGNPDCDWTSAVLGNLLPEGLPARPRRALVFDREGGWLAAAVESSTRIGPVDVDVVVMKPGDRDRPQLPPPIGSYDLIFSNGWLGSAANRQHFASDLIAALAPGGFLVGDEWVGPEDGRTDPRTLGYARQVGELMQAPGAPPATAREVRRDRWVDFEHGRLRRLFGPRERSLDEILGPRAEILIERPTGGALLQRVLAPAWDLASETAETLASLTGFLEELLTEAGVMKSEYACFIARRR